VYLPVASSIPVNEQRQFTIEIIAASTINDPLDETVTLNISTYANNDPDKSTTVTQASFDVAVHTDSASSDVVDLTPYILGIAALGILVIVILSALGLRRYR
jgi:hypothetical protein